MQDHHSIGSEGEKQQEKAIEDGARPDLTQTSSATEDVMWWEAEDTKVRRKLDIHIVPLLCIAYLFAFLDRSNIGNAKTAGMNMDLGISDSKYQWLLTIFYISYIIFQVGVLGYKLFPPSKWMGALVVFWGAGAVLQAAAFNWSGLMAARFFIGGIEACFGTGVALYLSFFYPRREVGLRFAIYLVGSAIASALAGSIAYGLQQTHTSVASWRLIFIVEAAPTILIGIAIFIWLPDSITTARFLTPQEKKIAEARLYRATIDVQHASDPSNNDSNAVVAFIKSRLDTSNFLSALKDPFSYVSASLLFIINVGYSSVPVYLPTILQGMGYTSLRAQAFSAPPYVGAFVIALLLVYISDRTDIRGCFIVLAAVISAVGYLILAIVEDNSTRYGAVWLVVIGLFSFIPLAYSWLLANTLGESKKGLALVMFGAIGQCGPILGTKLFPATQAPYYRHGMWVSTGVILLGLVITLVTLVVFWRINRRRDAEMNRLYEDEKGSLRYQRKLDLSNSDHRQEMHRRKVDMAEKREASIYFRYSL